jgi:hypothetical protein
MVSLLDRLRGLASKPVVPESEPDDFYQKLTLQQYLQELRVRLFYGEPAWAWGELVGWAGLPPRSSRFPS